MLRTLAPSSLVVWLFQLANTDALGSQLLKTGAASGAGSEAGPGAGSGASSGAGWWVPRRGSSS